MGHHAVKTIRGRRVPRVAVAVVAMKLAMHAAGPVTLMTSVVFGTAGRKDDREQRTGERVNLGLEGLKLVSHCRNGS